MKVLYISGSVFTNNPIISEYKTEYRNFFNVSKIKYKTSLVKM